MHKQRLRVLVTGGFQVAQFPSRQMPPVSFGIVPQANTGRYGRL